MKSVIPLLFLSLLLIACKESINSVSQKDVIKLDFCYSLRVKGVSYCLKFATGDTVFIDDHNPLRNDSSYYALLQIRDKKKVASQITNLNLAALDSSYDSGDNDGDEYNLTISKNDTIKKIYVHSERAPKELMSLIATIRQLKETLELRTFDKK